MFKFWRNRKPLYEVYPDTYMPQRQLLDQQISGWVPPVQAPSPNVPDVVLVLAHFPSTFAKLESAFDQRRQPFRVVTDPITPAWLQQQYQGSQRPERLVLGLVQQLDVDQEPDFAAQDDTPADGNVSVLVAERHFLSQHDLKVPRFLQSVAAHRRLGYFVGLDDPLFRHFSHKALHLILEHHGMDQESVIQSPMVDRHVKMVQRRYARLVPTDGFAESPDQWLKVYCPDLKP